LHVVLRTCDTASLQSSRIVPKDECIFRCLHSLVKSLENLSTMEYTLHIIDDRSTDNTVTMIRKIAPKASINLLGQRDDSHLNPKQKSRYSARKAFEYIYSLPEEDLVYLVEDDYLHYSDSMEKMIEAYNYFNHYLPNVDVGMFTQDFPELYAHPRNLHNETYFRQCFVFPGPDRYYRTTWYTHESFMIPLSVMHRYKEHFDSMLTIGDDPGLWEGNTISNVWLKPDVTMLMPMRTLAIHVSKQEDIPFFNTDFETLWEQNKIS
jgi:glycosyltransferase involved in cell wall biosynthesis